MSSRSLSVVCNKLARRDPGGAAASGLVSRTVSARGKDGPFPAAISNDRPELANRTLYYPGEWQDALDQESGGTMSQWIRDAVFDWLDAQGVPAHRPVDRSALPVKEPKPAKVKPVKVREVGPCSRTKQLAAEARDESRWPVGRGVCMGAITGRPYVGTVVRDERAEGVAA